MNHRARRARYGWQVFGLTGTHGNPCTYWPSLPSRRSLRASADDGGRSCIPLRDSPGFSPGSLSRRILISLRRSMSAWAKARTDKPAACSDYLLLGHEHRSPWHRSLDLVHHIGGLGYR